MSDGFWKPSYPYYLANRPVSANTDLEVVDKYSGNRLTRVALADDHAIDEAIQKAVEAVRPLSKYSFYQRAEILQHCIKRILERREELVEILCGEAGKPLRDSRAEVARLVDTFRVAAHESVRPSGEVMTLDISDRAKGYRGEWKRFPIGACSFIAPFNFPLNLAAHKIAPALAMGCPFVLKPASYTPVSALVLGEILAETDLPPGSFSILPSKRDASSRFSEDERIKLLSFTGSPVVGWALKAKAGKKRVVLELGGNAGCIVDETWKDRDDAVQRLMVGSFSYAGQSCISVQRILLQNSVYDDYRARLVAATLKLKFGDPRLEETVVGPVITEAEAERLEQWIQSAVAKGAKVLCGGTRKGAVMAPTLLENVPPSERLVCEEAFGPLAILSRFETFEEAIQEVNRGRFGLQAGVFTQDVYRAEKAWEELEVGGVIIGDIPSFRVDNMPYGGVKDSGFGREGVRFAMEDMSEIRLKVLRTPSPT